MVLRKILFFLGVIAVVSGVRAEARPTVTDQEKYVISPKLLAAIAEQDGSIERISETADVSLISPQTEAATIKLLQSGLVQTTSLKVQAEFLRKILPFDASRWTFNRSARVNLLKRMQLVDQGIFFLAKGQPSGSKPLSELYQMFLSDPSSVQTAAVRDAVQKYHILTAQKLALGRVLQHLYPTNRTSGIEKKSVREIIQEEAMILETRWTSFDRNVRDALTAYDRFFTPESFVMGGGISLDDLREMDPLSLENATKWRRPKKLENRIVGDRRANSERGIIPRSAIHSALQAR